MRLLLSALLVSGLLATAARAEQRVVATLQPIALVVEALTGEMPTVLSDGGAGHEHGGSLLPSDARAVAEADLVLWIGPALEPGIAAALREGSRAIALADVEGAPRRTGAGGVPDPHLWLDPAGMEAMGDAIAAALPTILGERAPDGLDAAAARFAEALSSARKAIASRMEPLAARPYAVEHDAFRHFAEAFGLAEPLAFGTGAMGARTLRAARAEVAERGITCLIVEPGEPSRLAEALGDDVRPVAIDPLGRDATDPVDLLERVARGFEACLRDGAGG